MLSKLTPFRVFASIGILLIVVAFFVQVHLALPLMGFILSLSCLIMELVFSLKTERNEINGMKQYLEDKIETHDRNLRTNLNAMDTRISRLEGQRLF